MKITPSNRELFVTAAVRRILSLGEPKLGYEPQLGDSLAWLTGYFYGAVHQGESVDLEDLEDNNVRGAFAARAGDAWIGAGMIEIIKIAEALEL